MELKNYWAQDASGNVIPSPVGYLYLPDTETKATGLQDATGAALPNPFTGSAGGQFQVAAPDGEYDLRIVGAGRDFTMRVRFADGAAVAANAAIAVAAREITVAAKDIAVASADDALAAAGFDTRDAAITFAPKVATGETTSVWETDTGTHAAVAGEVRLDGTAATVGEQIPNEGRYTKQASGALWRTSSSERQSTQVVIDEANIPADAAPKLALTDIAFYHPQYAHIQVDSTGRLLELDGNPVGGAGSDNTAAEVAAARGTAPNLNARLSTFLTPSGLPKSLVYAGSPFCNIPQLLSRMAASVSGSVLSFALVGDSWTDNNYYAPLLCAALSAKYGNAGDGFCPIARGSALGGASLSLTTGGGGWVTVNTATGGGPTPGAALIAATSSTPGDYIRYGGATAHTSAFLHSVGNGTVVEVSTDDGATWGAPLTLSGAPLRVDQIANASFNYLRVRLISGTWTVSGVEGRRAGPGIRWHNLGAGSGTMARAVSCPEADYVTSLAALAPSAISMGWGVNEGLGGTAASTFIANQNALLARFDAAAPLSDRLVWSPPEVLGGAPVMREYDAATRENSAGKFTHLSLQPLFGDLVSDYGDAGRQLLGTLGGGGGDANHPTLWGSHAIKSALQSVIEGYSL